MSKELELEINGLKNQLAKLDKKVDTTSSVGSRTWDDVVALKKGNDDLENKIKNISIKVGEVADITKKQVEEGGGSGGLSLDEEELKKLIIANMPYDKIKTVVEKLLAENGGLAVSDKPTSVKKQKSSKGGFLIGVFVLIAIAFGVFRFIEQEKMQTGIMPVGTEYYDYKRDKMYRLTKDKKVTGHIVQESGEDGVKRYFVATEIKDGEGVKYKFFIKQ